MKRIISILFILAYSLINIQAQSISEQASSRIKELKALISKANKKGIPTLKERTVIRTAEIFLKYADYDEKHIPINTKHFSLVARYKSEPEKYAKLLPKFERSEIVKMLNDSKRELEQTIDGKIKRLPSPNIDWSKTKIEGDEILFNNKPVFLADWTWKPSLKEYNEYFGNQDGFFLTPTYVINEKGEVSTKVINQLKDKPNGNMGFIFINHTSIPNWAKQKYPIITNGSGIKYVMYDINNPISLKIDSTLIAATVPLMKGKQYTKLGYMLCNEPHWNTIENTWASGPISDDAFEAFKVWLKNKHKNINQLNKIWNKSYSSFDEIDCPKIMKNEMRGIPMYFDFMAFNMDRVTNWFSFLQKQIKKYDPQAKTHIKIMPSLWTGNNRDSGIDMEALTYNSDIIGNDAGSCGPWMWGKPQFWEANYSFDWIEPCMGYDFYKSVSPEKIIFNTEGHFLSTGKYRDLFQTKEYTRCNYWLACIHGLTAIQTWYWCRREDGSCRNNEDSNGYAGSNNQQPRVVNEVHSTMIDLNSVSDKIMAFQRQRKPIRIFYTKASSINLPEYMNNIFKVYESLFFNGYPIGFATEGIIRNQPNDRWNVIVVTNTPYAFKNDITALQSYLNNGGTVIVDRQSLKKDEYNNPLNLTLDNGNGKLIIADNATQASKLSLDIINNSNKLALPLTMTEDNGLTQRGCDWRVIDGDNNSKIVNIVNIGKNPAKITLRWKCRKTVPSSITNVLTGEKIDTNHFNIPVNGVMLIKVKH